MAVITSSDLCEIIKAYDPDANENLIKKAFAFAVESHGSQKRASGAPYYSHPIEVAKILTDFKLDVPTVITGLLHDVIEDTEVSSEEIEELFGAEIAFLVEGVTKLSKINYTSEKVRQAENFRKFLLAIAKDIRVLFVKLVDRLHNIRTLSHIASLEKRKRIALETLEIYAPLAERIGVNVIKEEIEDVAFYTLHPEECRAIQMRLEDIRKQDTDFVSSVINELEKLFERANIHTQISGRQKKAYSIWKKMHTRNIPLEQINDIVAFRVIVDSVEKCYLALGVIHTRYRIMPGRFKDYISVPKLNDYKSLHTTVIGPSNQKIEIQIRTKEMHKIADEGIAAHWAYKSDCSTRNYEQKEYNWIKGLLTVLQNSGKPEDVMDNSKLEMFETEVFCFTPKGDLIILPRGASVIDFSYAIHTSIGNTCIGVKVNNKMVPLRTILHNGDQVDIITSPYQSPEAAWIKFAITGKAKSCIKKYIAAKENTEFLILGLQLAKYVFATAGESFDESLVDYKKFSCKTIDAFYCSLGKGLISMEKLKSSIPHDASKIIMFDESINIVDFTPGIAVHFSECCHPILGDSIIGILTPNMGIVIHSTSCEKIALALKEMVKVRWNKYSEADSAFIAKLRIVIFNTPDSFAIITNIISSNAASITNIKVEHRSIEFFDLLIDIKVKDNNHFGEVQAALRTSINVRSVRRL